MDTRSELSAASAYVSQYINNQQCSGDYCRQACRCSAFRASTGLTEEARRAGIKLASNAEIPNTAATPASVDGSHAHAEEQTALRLPGCNRACLKR